MMRARGAKVTDIVVLVVAADDGVMPQTLEAIDHAKAANVPIVVAINKIDKANANLDRVKRDLADHGLMLEEWGGDVPSVPVSAIKGQGIDELLEMILLTADLLELKADPDLAAQGVVLEARKEPGRGIVATVLVQNGTLRVGDVFVSGATWGRVRSMTDERGLRVTAGGPSTPVEVTGFAELPDAGDTLQVVDSEQRRALDRRVPPAGGAPPRAAADARLALARAALQPDPGRRGQGAADRAQGRRAGLGRGAARRAGRALDRQGQGQDRARAASAPSPPTTSCSPPPPRRSSSASTSGPSATPPSSPRRKASTSASTPSSTSSSTSCKKAMTGLLEPTLREVSRGRAEVRETFKVPKIGTIAGCHVVEGVIPRSGKVRLLRDNVVVYEGRISSLRRFKDDASEVRTGFDCGIGLERFQDVKPGDVIEAYDREEVAATL